MPPIRRTNGPGAAVMSNRSVQAERNRRDRAAWERPIEAHVAAHRMAVDFLAETHQWIADNRDFELDAHSRPAAVWQMSGRCLGIARLVCDASMLGYTSEILHLMRALHEADRLLMIFGLPEGEELLGRWLADDGNDWVRPREVRQAEDAFESRLADAMRARDLPEIARTEDKTRALYGYQSEAAHHRRKWTQDAVAPLLREMIYGPTEAWERRANHVAAGLGVVEESVTTVGDALSPFMAEGWFTNHIKPFSAAFDALRTTQPLHRQ